MIQRSISIDTNAASGGNPQLKQILDLVKDYINTPVPASTATPFTAAFTVTGQDASFIIDITPAYSRTPSSQAIRATQAAQGNIQTGQNLQHQLRCADDLAMTTNVITYGPDARTHWEIPNPDVRKYWQLHSTYDGGQTYNDWAYYIDPAVCGPARVWSGLVRSTSVMPNVPPNQTNYCTVDSVPAGATATIRVYGSGGVGSTWSWQIGGTVKSGYPAGTLTGYAFSTAYYIVFDTQDLIFRVFTTAQYPSILPDTYIFCGKTTTCAADGTGVVVGGGGDTGDIGCTEAGTKLYFDRITESAELELIPCSEWIAIRYTENETPLMVHPDTLVGVWRKAKNLITGDLMDVGDDGDILPMHSATPVNAPSFKQKMRVIPHRAYRAGARKQRLHNMKIFI